MGTVFTLLPFSFLDLSPFVSLPLIPYQIHGFFLFNYYYLTIHNLFYKLHIHVNNAK